MFVMPLYVSNLSFLLCLGRAVLRDCDIFGLSSFMFYAVKRSTINIYIGSSLNKFG